MIFKLSPGYGMPFSFQYLCRAIFRKMQSRPDEAYGIRKETGA